LKNRCSRIEHQGEQKMLLTWKKKNS
jgi:hypothetical protein